MRFFCSGFLHWSNIYRPNNKAFECLWFCTWIHQLIRILKDLSITQLTSNLIPCQLSKRQVRLNVDCVNAEWDSTSNESMQNNEIFVNVGAFCVVSVDVESHSVLTQLTWSLTLHWLSWRGDSLWSTRFAEDESNQNRQTYPALVPLTLNRAAM